MKSLRDWDDIDWWLAMVVAWAVAKIGWLFLSAHHPNVGFPMVWAGATLGAVSMVGFAVRVARDYRKKQRLAYLVGRRRSK